MIVAIHQPEYLPWPGFFHKILNCDIYVVLDMVEFSRGGFQNRNRIKTKSGAKWLTVPISGSTMLPINEVKIDNSQDWARKHWKTLEMAYHKAPFFKELADFFQEVYQGQVFEKILDLNLAINEFLGAYLGIETRTVLASDLEPVGNKTDRLIDVCKKLHANVYLSGIGAKIYRYLEEDKFKKSGISLQYQNFSFPKHPQQFGEFVPNLSILDMIFNVGKKQTLKLISQ